MTLAVQFTIDSIVTFLPQRWCLSVFSALSLYILCLRYKSGLRSVPGPWLASVSNIWRFTIVWKRNMPTTCIRLHEKHGPLVRLGPNHVSVADPDALAIIYGADSRYRKVNRTWYQYPLLLTHMLRAHSIKQLRPAMKAKSLTICSQPLVEISTLE